MPSGAKKRKAAKKKMVKEDNNNNYGTHSNVLANGQTMDGDDEPKQQPQFTEEGEKLESRSTVRSNVSERNPQKKLNHDGENLQEGAIGEDSVHINREDVKSKDFNGKISTTDNEKESNDSSSSESSTSSSSDDESHVLEKVETTPPLDSNKQIDYAETEDISAIEVNHSVKETENVVDSDKIVILDYAIESDDGSSNDESRSLEKEKAVYSNKPVNSSYQEEIKVTDVVNPVVEEFGSTVESDNDLKEKKVEETASIDESHVLDEKTAVDEIDETAPAVDLNRSEEFNHLVEETIYVLSSINVPSLKKIVHVNGSASVDNSGTSWEVVESVSNENGEKKNLSMEEIAETPSTMMDVGSQNQVVESGSKENGEKMFPSMVSSVEQYAKDSVVPMNEDESSLSLIAPKIDTSNGEECVKSDTHECSDSQPLVDSAPRTVQTTSWKNCCGIFELFTGGNR